MAAHGWAIIAGVQGTPSTAALMFDSRAHGSATRKPHDRPGIRYPRSNAQAALEDATPLCKDAASLGESTAPPLGKIAAPFREAGPISPAVLDRRADDCGKPSGY
eukprot:scaffold5290_cov63-Phaeocystis_antarctica.AAC.5